MLEFHVCKVVSSADQMPSYSPSHSQTASILITFDLDDPDNLERFRVPRFSKVSSLTDNEMMLNSDKSDQETDLNPSPTLSTSGISLECTNTCKVEAVAPDSRTLLINFDQTAASSPAPSLDMFVETSVIAEGMDQIDFSKSHLDEGPATMTNYDYAECYYSKNYLRISQCFESHLNSTNQQSSSSSVRQSKKRPHPQLTIFQLSAAFTMDTPPDIPFFKKQVMIYRYASGVALK